MSAAYTPWYVITGDACSVLNSYQDDCFDSLVTDPPSGTGFMAREWDSDKGGRVSWIAWLELVMKEALRVLKPGAHALVWALPRTSHWTATALEQAGFDIRDVVTHHFGTGFPKSLNLSGGWGTALKPASEHWILCRKPLSQTVVANVRQYGTGGINIDASRIAGRDRVEYGLASARRTQGVTYSTPSESPDFDSTKGRWPANLVLSHSNECGPSLCAHGCAVAELGTQSRFFYVQKPSTAEREEGLEHMPKKTASELVNREEDSAGINNPRAGAGRTSKGRANHHPTVKSVELMSYLVKLITPVGGCVLDPFCGSGSTGIAAVTEGFAFVGIEKEPEFADIANARIKWWYSKLLPEVKRGFGLKRSM